jgi:LysR family glycine cleavage system transcriptional activator
VARTLPPLVALRAFEASARLGSHRRAAEELCVDHTVVSKHIRKLEQDLGTQLMTAGPAGTQLTAAGAEYYRHISEALGVIATATERLRERNACPTLHVACSPGFAVRWLVPRISHFLEASPRARDRAATHQSATEPARRRGRRRSALHAGLRGGPPSAVARQAARLSGRES